MIPDHFNQEAITQAQRDIEGLRVEVNHLRDTVNELKASNANTLIEFRVANKEIMAMISSIQQTLSEARGGWRALMLVGGAVTTVSALVYWAATHIQWR
jgi:hypothetical protein